MNKPYSNKALPAGTVLREWRLEEVLGVGGFGIVYKGRGIYFNELVAIKEYFPSSISERAEDDTVVPVDSNAEEVHALGLKKFVEEAKLLWNLSTPTRHPNIVSVRSLFEIHGTAYMVMDFEDGTPLSQLLKQGIRFNQAALSRIILPVAEGLDRAHRVGVLHRDIKPPNIMVGADDRAVLIDFGSARFESGDATSTKVTFYTPPYAPIEQYVKTYEQGPWTDIYALGVVLYECVTGTKPPEVLERLHGAQDKPLAEGDWPGFTQTFLRAIDAAMTVRPNDRPRSIPEWLAMFEEGKARAVTPVQPDEDATVIGTFADDPGQIIPLAPIQLTDAPAVAPEASGQADLTEVVKTDAPIAPNPKPKPAVPQKEAARPKTEDKKRLSKGLLAGVAGAAVLAVAGITMLGGDSADEPAAATIETPDDVSGYPAMFTALAKEAESAGIGQETNALLAIEDGKLDSPDSAIARLREFGAAALAEGEAKASKVGRDLPWADVSRNGSARNESAARRKAADDLKAGITDLRAKASRVGEASGLEDVLAAVREEISSFGTLTTLSANAYRAKGTQDSEPETVPSDNAAIPTVTPTETPTTAETTAAEGVSASTAREFSRIVSDARNIAQEIEKLANRNKPGDGATDKEKENYRIRQASANSARQYISYLDTLEASMRGTTTESEARNSLAKASQTKSYLQALLNRSKAAR